MDIHIIDDWLYVDGAIVRIDTITYVGTSQGSGINNYYFKIVTSSPHGEHMWQYNDGDGKGDAQAEADKAVEIMLEYYRDKGKQPEPTVPEMFDVITD